MERMPANRTSNQQLWPDGSVRWRPGAGQYRVGPESGGAQQMTAVKRSSATTVAVVIFSYNYESYLRQCIDSVLNQSTQFDQILVIDDESTDGSRSLIASYGDRIDSVFQKNTGQLGAAVTSLKHIKTSFVYFLDADDYADPDARETIGRHLAGNPIKLQFQLRCVDGEGTVLDSIFPAYRRGYSSSDMIRDNEVIGFYVSPPTSGNVFSVNALKALPLSDLLQSDPVDGSPMLCMPYLGEVRSIPRVIANYRLHGENTTQQDAPTPAIYQRSLDRHARRWREMEKLAPNADAPARGTTAIELEAQCLTNPIVGKRVPTNLAMGYTKALFKSSMTFRMKVMLSLFMLALTVLPASIGYKLIVARRSPRSRNRVLKKMLRFLLGVQATQRL